MGENQIYVSSAHSTRPPNSTQQQQQMVDNSLSSYQHPFKPNAQVYFLSISLKEFFSYRIFSLIGMVHMQEEHMEEI